MKQLMLNFDGDSPKNLSNNLKIKVVAPTRFSNLAGSQLKLGGSPPRQFQDVKNGSSVLTMIRK